jgi:hypothetical protein
MPAFPQPRGGGSQAKRLAAQFVGSDEKNFHDNDSIARGAKARKTRRDSSLRSAVTACLIGGEIETLRENEIVSAGALLRSRLS